ncbi:MAG: hypothetical protein QNJ41_03070 [Xenococcaceae cyanobacterium MO_188.B32]|nr:hypothetical protein [Xenococcaceae cyanobacterium MO_188.B32]
MQLYEVIWKAQFVEKLALKHNVTINEVEEVLFSRPHIRKARKGRVKGEDLYVAYGQTYSGRYLVIFFVCKNLISALPISARDMTGAERKYYERQA